LTAAVAFVVLAAIGLFVWPGHLLRSVATPRGTATLAALNAAPPSPSSTPTVAPSTSEPPAVISSPTVSASPPPPRAPRATGVDGLWQGTYTCRQGLTGMTMNIGPAGTGKLKATFEFYAVPSNPGVPTGSAAMTGTVSGTKMTMRWQKWLVQPPSYVAVGFSGSVRDAGATLSGTITASGCSTFHLTRVKALSVPAHGTDLAGLWDDHHGTVYQIDALGSGGGAYTTTVVADAGYVCGPVNMAFVGSDDTYIGSQDVYGNLNGGRRVGDCGDKTGTATLLVQVEAGGGKADLVWSDTGGSLCGQCVGVAWSRVVISP